MDKAQSITLSLSLILNRASSPSIFLSNVLFDLSWQNSTNQWIFWKFLGYRGREFTKQNFLSLLPHFTIYLDLNLPKMGPNPTSNTTLCWKDVPLIFQITPMLSTWEAISITLGTKVRFQMGNLMSFFCKVRQGQFPSGHMRAEPAWCPDERGGQTC